MKKLLLLPALFILQIHSFGQNVDYIVESIDFRTPVTAVNISPEQEWILAGLEDGTLHVLDISTRMEILKIEGAGLNAIYDIEMTPTGDVIFVAAGNRISLFDTSGKPLTVWGHHRNTIWSMDISHDGQYMASTEVNKTFQLIDVFTGERKQFMRGHDDVVLAVDFSPDGKLLASGSNDKKVFLWEMDSLRVIQTFQGLSDNIYDVAFSPDGKYLAAASKDESVRIWDIEKNKLFRLLKGHKEMVLEIEFSPDGKYLLSAGADGAIKLWDIKSGEQLYAYLENEGAVADICFLPGGKTFVSAGMDENLKIWELNPEIFVLKYFPEDYKKEMENDPLFLPRQKGEKRSEYNERTKKASGKKKEIIDRYYRQYLQEYAE
ncbi:MAG: WD40 repeat domain-containing protein [Bacteroidales bacterium]|nr:WD40 repeat domain-containing protein [Bacteroidales bacterium]